MARFEKGCPPGPGRPRGCRNKAPVWFDQLGEQGTARVIEVVSERAQAGDMHAAAIMLRRTWPHRRRLRGPLDLPSVETSGGLVAAQAAVVAAMSRGDLTPDEAASVASVLENQRRAIETHDHERRIRELEEEEAKRARPAAADVISWL
ncbi:MAG: hypothetical protein JSR47_01380 [Proteobacteria bacterium]|nr:hypothetical protein [Pseudomonadota bacterium]